MPGAEAGTIGVLLPPVTQKAFLLLGTRSSRWQGELGSRAVLCVLANSISPMASEPLVFIHS